MAKSVLLPDVRLLAQAARNGQLSDAEKREVLSAVRALPEDAFDWVSAWGIESVSTENMLRELQSASDSGAAYEAIMGKPAPKQGLPPTGEDIQTFREYMLAVGVTLRETPAKASTVIDGLQIKRAALGEVEQNMIPNPQAVNTARLVVMTARADLMRAMGAK